MPGYPPIEFFFTSEKTMDLGGQKVEIDGQEVKIYNRERTVCDMFRYMDRTGIDAAIEVFKNYMSDKQGRNIPVLLEYSRRLRVYKYISQYVEVTIG